MAHGRVKPTPAPRAAPPPARKLTPAQARQLAKLLDLYLDEQPAARSERLEDVRRRLSETR